MQYVKRINDASNGLPNTPQLDDESFRLSYPALHEYLTLDHWDDGTPRRTSTLLTFCEEGQWKACLNDREAERSAWVSAEVFEDVLLALDRRLADGTVEWRRSTGFNGGKSGKRAR